MGNKTTKTALIVVAGVLVLCLAGYGIFSLLGNKEHSAEKEVMEKRLAAMINVGWGWLHAEDTKVVRLQMREKQSETLFDYTLVLDMDQETLPAEEIERFRKYLPMCWDVPIKKGNRCALQEQVLFTNTPEYGWVPSLLLGQPAMLSEVLLWQGHNTSSQQNLQQQQ